MWIHTPGVLLNTSTRTYAKTPAACSGRLRSRFLSTSLISRIYDDRGGLSMLETKNKH